MYSCCYLIAVRFERIPENSHCIIFVSGNFLLPSLQVRLFILMLDILCYFLYMYICSLLLLFNISMYLSSLILVISTQLFV